MCARRVGSDCRRHFWGRPQQSAHAREDEKLYALCGDESHPAACAASSGAAATGARLGNEAV